MTQPSRAYWRSLDDLARTKDFADAVARAAPRFADVAGAFDRRRFLQLMAASMALGGLSGCAGTEVDPRQLLPYVEQPENVIPGRDNFYATAVTQDGCATGVLVTHQMARPIKVEGNPDHPASLGAASAILQASILDFYDPRRAQTIVGAGVISSWEGFEAALRERRDALLKTGGAGLRVLTGPTGSPLIESQRAALAKMFPAMRWSSWAPLHRDNEMLASQKSFGQPAERIFHVAAARRILGVESDLIANAPGALAYARAFAAARRPAETGGTMSRVYAIESTPTLLGAKADHRLPMQPDEMFSAMRMLAGLLGAGPQDWAQQPHPHAAWIKAAADDFSQHKGAALVHAGREQPVEIHVLADAINNALGGFGKTVSLIAPPQSQAQPKQDALAELTQEMSAGKVETLVILGANPVYDAPADLDFAAALKKVPFSACLALYDDETARACTWRLPAAHELEMWGDARAFEGALTIQQPQARPLYGGRAPSQLLAALLGDLSPDDYQLTRAFWRTRRKSMKDAEFETFWHDAVQKGVVANSAAPALNATFRADAVENLPAPEAPPNQLQALFRPDEAFRDGNQTSNPWLLELPRTFTRLTWDNAALVAPATARKLGVSTQDVVEITIDDRKLNTPVFVLPGQAEDCITLPLGWGREAGGLGMAPVSAPIACARRKLPGGPKSPR